MSFRINDKLKKGKYYQIENYSVFSQNEKIKNVVVIKTQQKSKTNKKSNIFFLKTYINFLSKIKLLLEL